MICRGCCGFDEFFDRKVAVRDLRRYRRRGPIPSTRLLIEAIVAEGVRGATLLDIGGGAGAIQHELVAAGAARVLDVDGSAAYLAVAREEAERRGYADRASYTHADFVDAAAEVEPADVVTLDRVICCYPDVEALVLRSAERARAIYGLVYPRPIRLVKLLFPVLNLAGRIRRCPMRLYLHPPHEVDRLVRSMGLEPRRRARTLLWEVAVYGRAAR